MKQRDELLENKWANGGEVVIERQPLQNNRQSKNKKGKKETVQVITKDLIRNLM